MEEAWEISSDEALGDISNDNVEKLLSGHPDNNKSEIIESKKVVLSDVIDDKNKSLGEIIPEEKRE